MASPSAQRVRKFRKARREAGLVELRIWVAKEDREAALNAVAGFVREGARQSARHQMYGPEWRAQQVPVVHPRRRAGRED
jgi:hypothetical protein